MVAAVSGPDVAGAAVSVVEGAAAGAGAAAVSVAGLASSPLLQAITATLTLIAIKANTNRLFTFFMCFGLSHNITTLI